MVRATPTGRARTTARARVTRPRSPTPRFPRPPSRTATAPTRRATPTVMDNRLPTPERRSSRSTLTRRKPTAATMATLGSPAGLIRSRTTARTATSTATTAGSTRTTAVLRPLRPRCRLPPPPRDRRHPPRCRRPHLRHVPVRRRRFRTRTTPASTARPRAHCRSLVVTSSDWSPSASVPQVVVPLWFDSVGAGAGSGSRGGRDLFRGLPRNNSLSPQGPNLSDSLHL